MSSTTRDVVTTPHLGKGTALVQKTMLGFMKTFAWEGKESRPCERATAFATDSSGFSYRTMETVYLLMISQIKFVIVRHVEVFGMTIFVCLALERDKNFSLCPVSLLRKYIWVPLDPKIPLPSPFIKGEALVLFVLPLFRKEGRGEICLVRSNIAFSYFQGAPPLSGHERLW
jgi:hypothetical protein